MNIIQRFCLKIPMKINLSEHMNNKFKIIFISMITSLMISITSFAGFHNLTHHSRANCGGVNETISWQFNYVYPMCISSIHTKVVNKNHIIHHYEHSFWLMTWRAAIVHWPEALKETWEVEGRHWMLTENNMPYLVKREIVKDCSIYDGWWDN